MFIYSKLNRIDDLKWQPKMTKTFTNLGYEIKQYEYIDNWYEVKLIGLMIKNEFGMGIDFNDICGDQITIFMDGIKVGAVKKRSLDSECVHWTHSVPRSMIKYISKELSVILKEFKRVVDLEEEERKTILQKEEDYLIRKFKDHK